MNRWQTKRFARRGEVYQAFVSLNQKMEQQAEAICQEIQRIGLEECQKMEELSREVQTVKQEIQRVGLEDRQKMEELSREVQTVNQEIQRVEMEDHQQIKHLLQMVQAARQEEQEQIQELRGVLVKKLTDMKEYNSKHWKQNQETMKKHKRIEETRFDEMEKLIKLLLLNDLSDDIEELTSAGKEDHCSASDASIPNPELRDIGGIFSSIFAPYK